MSKRTTTLFALFTAAAAGAAVAMLIAPDTGKNTRRKLKKAAVNAKDTLAYRMLQGEEHLDRLRNKPGKNVAAAMEAIEDRV